MSNTTLTPERDRPSTQPNWHALSADTALNQLVSTDQGLTEPEAKKRLGEYGPNVLQKASGDGPLQLLWRQINSPLIWVLIASGFLAIALGKGTDGLVVLAVVVLNTIIGFVQEFKAGKAIEALSAMVPENATVIRDGRKITIPVADLVPGDLVTLASGDKVPADARLIAVRNLQIEEAALTGESVPTEKQLNAVSQDASIGDRTNMAFGGTLVTYGTGTALIVSTGAKTELGRISTMLKEATDLETPLTKALGQIGKVITIAILIVAVLMIAVGTTREVMVAGAEPMAALRNTIIFAIALAVGAIPEGLPAIVTIALAIGVQRMASRRAIIRKLPAVETLGSTTTICSDKTGTLTRNEMTVQALWTKGGAYVVTGVGYEPVGALQKNDAPVAMTPDVNDLILAGSLCNDASVHQESGVWKMTGDPTEGALVTSALKLGIDVEKARVDYKRIDAIPFESEHQFMATLHSDPLGNRTVMMKGAPEAVLKRCSGIDRDAVLHEVEQFAAQGMRVLAFASRPCDDNHERIEMSDVDSGLTFLGLQAMIDPPRPEAIEAIRACHAAGINVKMITGDHKSTAQAIGRQLNIAKEGGSAVTGAQLADMSESDLREIVKTNNVFARVAPEHKLKLVKALQANGGVVAMTGDGVNDAPALKQSNIGVAMGITGTSVSKEAADIVLTDDNFASIAAAVEEGRRVYDNLIKSLAFVLPTNLGLAFILMYAVGFNPFDPVTKELLLPMQPTQLLWINLVATIALALPLAFEAKEPNVMSRPPRDPSEPVLSKFVISRTVVAAVLMTIGAVGLFTWEYQTSLQAGIEQAMALGKAQTMAVTTVIMFQIFYMLNCRSLKDSIFKIGFFSNPMVFLGIGALVLLQLAFIYLPPLQAVFQTQPLHLRDLGIAALVGAVILPVISIEKWLQNRRASA
jgi:Ca2+-transporting ATPase